MSTRYALSAVRPADPERDALLLVGNALDEAENVAIADLETNDLFRHGSPGEAIVALLGERWKLHAENELSIPNDYHESHVLQYNTVVLTHGDIMMAFQIRCYDYFPDRPRSDGDKTYDWRGLTAIQRFNALLAAAGNFAVGVGPDGLFGALVHVVEKSVYGSDPTNWIDAARILASDAHRADADPAVRDAMNHAIFLAQLGSPRFGRLFPA